MKISIDDKEYELSQQFVDQLKGTLMFMAQDLNLPLFNAKDTNSIMDIVDVLFTYVLNQYDDLNMVFRLAIMTFVRGKIVDLEKKFGEQIRPPRGEDPVKHVLGYFMLKTDRAITLLEEEILPHATIQIATRDNAFHSVNIRTHQDQTGGTLVADGDIGIRENNGGETDRQAIGEALLGDETLCIGQSAHGGFRFLRGESLSD
jgi:hypothetical protein